ncbi:YqcI/YcgG family protein (plasmid) [Mesorhizobium sp. AR07]|uniref:YqcI/YcgG family protein n=1 Tax=Mesorhizobium sp. AR07 TaxID=2865838 RepID=UPI00220134B6|nr:YqcI/YcgG family protein [Mesorhizobium sp. AR07]
MHGLPEKRGVGLTRPHFKQRDNAHTTIHSIDLNHHRPLLVLFEPVITLTTTDQFTQVFIEAMQFLIDEDHGPWPVHVSKDTAHHTWTMCFHGCELFVNVSHPGHVLRKSRLGARAGVRYKSAQGLRHRCSC